MLADFLHTQCRIFAFCLLFWLVVSVFLSLPLLKQDPHPSRQMNNRRLLGHQYNKLTRADFVADLIADLYSDMSRLATSKPNCFSIVCLIRRGVSCLRKKGHLTKCPCCPDLIFCKRTLRSHSFWQPIQVSLQLLQAQLLEVSAYPQ